MPLSASMGRSNTNLRLSGKGLLADLLARLPLKANHGPAAFQSAIDTGDYGAGWGEGFPFAVFHTQGLGCFVSIAHGIRCGLGGDGTQLLLVLCRPRLVEFGARKGPS